MARAPTSTAVAEPITNNGLRFMNSAWNDTIANGELYNLNWDRSLHGIDSSLGVYQISYLEDGIIAYKLAVDITQHADDRIARWTPRDLDDGLYVFWLQTIGEDPERWAISPPWEPSEPRPHDLKWATPIGIPIAVMMGIYFISLVTCLLYRRKKKARSRRAEIRESERRAMLADQRRRRQQEDEAEDPLTGDRHPSVTSLDTASTSVEEDVAKPECVVIYEKSPRRSGSRRPSHSEVLGQTSQSRRPSHTEPFPQVSQGRRPSQPESFRSVGQSRRPSQPESFRSVSQSRRPSQSESFHQASQSRRPSQPESLYQFSQNRRPSHPDLFHQVSQRRRPSHPDLFQVCESRLPSHPDLFHQVSQNRRPSHPELFVEIRSTRRRPSRPDLSDEVSPTRRPSQAETFIDGLPATEVGMAL